MFTQCSKCETVFRLSAEILRAAGGKVRCGRCGEVFDALARLEEDAAGFAKGESSFDLETRADQILDSTALHTEAQSTTAHGNGGAAHGTEIAQLEIIDPPEEALVAEPASPADPALPAEALPAGELDRIFVETASPAIQRFVADVPRPAAASGGLEGLEVAEDVRDEMLASYTHAELPEINAPQRRLPLALWLSAAIVLAVLLVGQVIYTYGNRNRVSADLAAYQLRQWGVTGDPGAQGTLRVRASIMNAARELRPYPLLRLSLANRFGTLVGEREFEPVEYMGHATARPLGPGERVDALLDILDPGTDTVGFEIDVCLRDAESHVLCAGDAAARTR